MHLTRIDIFGFKSFAQEVHLEFPPGITALVGPNGGGKSNVVDAIRWALGEQRIRELRAEKWEDLLHTGSPGRAPARLAEVTLHFDNHDQEMPHWSESLAVTRRYYRSGDSEYLINGKAGRLKDVTDLFLDSGLGRFNYAIISQGRVESALLQKPVDRLEQLEEAAGVSRYKMRKRETLTHLQDVESKLTRLNDLTHEVSRQVEDVRERADNESRYLALEQERQVIQDRLEFTEVHRAMLRVQELETGMAALEKERLELQWTLKELVEGLGKKRSAITEEEALSKTHTEDVRRLTQRESEIRLQLGRAEAELEGLRRERETLQTSLVALETEVAELVKEAPPDDSLDQELEKRRVQVDDARAEADRAQERLRALALSVEEMVERLSALNQTREGLARDLARMEGSLRLGQNEDLAQVIKERREEEAKLNLQVRELTQELVLKTDERVRLKEYQGNLEQEVYALRHQLAGRQARLRALHQLEAEGEGLAPGVRAILKAQHDGQLEGILGTLASLVETDSDLVLAIQTALGGAHQDVVVESEQHARLAVTHLKTGALGRATFLPLDTVRMPKAPEDERQIERSAGVVGWAAKLVRYPAQVRPAVLHILARVLIARTLEDAVTLGREYRFRYKTVTLDGQMTHAGGAITGGSRGSERHSRAARKTEIDTLTLRVEEDRALNAGKEELLLSTRQELESIEAEMDALREILSDRRNQWTTIRQQLALYQGYQDAEGALAEEARVRGEIEVLEGQIKLLREDQAQMRNAVEESRSRLADEERAWQELASTKREHVALAERSRREIERSRQRDSTLRARLAALDQREAECAGELTALGDVLARAEAERQEQETRHGGAARALDRLREDALKFENRMRVLQAEDRKMETRVAHWKQEALTLSARHEHYRAPGNVEPLDALAEPEAREALAKVRQALAEVGPVSPGSLALFQQLEERQAYLKREETDVIEAREELLTTIKDLDAEMGRRVEETSSRVEHAFQEACRQLYGGGDGGFSWVNGREGGVELWVKPPGKRPSTLSLLSGGEKALGGIAWIFALLTIRPAPFVVLDEVEASLDEANAARFAHYVKAAEGSTQYVIVTHHKTTMEAADALWGVAGDGRGQSRLVSVMLEEAT